MMALEAATTLLRIWCNGTETFNIVLEDSMLSELDHCDRLFGSRFPGIATLRLINSLHPFVLVEEAQQNQVPRLLVSLF